MTEEVLMARRDEITAEVATHEAAADPHPQYQKESEKGAANGYASLDAGGTVPDGQIPAGIARDSEVTAAVVTHEAAADPHTQYQKESEKGVANGYASLDAGATIPVLDPAQYAASWRTAGHLPSMPSPAEWDAAGKKMAVGDIVQRLWETVELQAVHIDKLRQRIEALEATRRTP